MPEDRATLLRRLRSRIETLRRLSWGDKLLLLEASFALSIVGMALRVLSFKRVHAALAKLVSTSPQAGGASRMAAVRAREVAHLVSMSARHTPLPNTCLHRSLALWWLLKRRGLDGRLQFGVRKVAGAFEAHAWVEYEGAIVSEDTAEDDFVRLAWEPLGHEP